MIEDNSRETFSDSNDFPQQEDKYFVSELSLLRLLLVLAKHKGLILKMTIGFALIAGIISIFMTPIYRVETRLIPPQVNSFPVEIVTNGRARAEANSRLYALNTTGEMITEVFRSKIVLDRIIDRFNLANQVQKSRFSFLEKFNFPGKKHDSSRSSSRKDLLGDMSISLNELSQIITLRFEDEDPELAADIANAFAEEVQKTLQTMAMKQFSRERIFIEEQLKNAQLDLIKAENSLKDYQKTSGIVDVDEQTSYLMQTLSRVQSQLSATEIELASARSYATRKNPAIKRLEAQKQQLQKQLLSLEAKTSTNDFQNPSIAEFSEAGMDYLRKLRDVRFHETLYNILLEQYESARIAEAKEPATLQVLDSATTPESPVRPDRKLIILLAGFLGFCLAFLTSLVMEYLENASSDPEQMATLQLLKTNLGSGKRNRSS